MRFFYFNAFEVGNQLNAKGRVFSFQVLGKLLGFENFYYFCEKFVRLLQSFFELLNVLVGLDLGGYLHALDLLEDPEIVF